MKYLLILPLFLVACASAPKPSTVVVEPLPKLARNDTFYAGCVNTYIRLVNVPAEKKSLLRAADYCKREIAQIGTIK